MESNPIQAFIHDLNKVAVLQETSFFDLYDYHFADFSRDLKAEIISNLSSLSEKKFNVYIKYLEFQIKDTFVYDPDVCIIEKWINEYKLNEADFPFLDNKIIVKLITKSQNDPKLRDDERVIVRGIQRSFYCYAVFLEANKMISFIESFIGKNSNTGNNFNQSYINDKLDNIFKSELGFEAFNYLFTEFGFERSEMDKRGNQAKLKGIWSSPVSREKIFKKHAQLKDYINYLNKNFNDLDLNSRSLSDGSKYHSSIKEWLSLFNND